MEYNRYPEKTEQIENPSRCEEPNLNVKLQRLLYLLHGALPLLRPTSCLEQDSEIEMEAESQGLERAEVNIRRIKLDEDERQYWYALIPSCLYCLLLSFFCSFFVISKYCSYLHLKLIFIFIYAFCFFDL
ncbi:hypothetical protein IFM89_015013, partial [Coptis chinensis]